MNSGHLIFFCGKMGAGKSTKSKQVAAERNAVLISEDEWLASLYPGQISTFEDYLFYSKRIKPLLESHIQSLLKAGASVVLDFPANTVKQRNWFKQLISTAQCPYEFYYLNISDELCLKQIAKRRIQQPQRAIFDTETMFRQVTKHFEPPQESEGLSITCL